MKKEKDLKLDKEEREILDAINRGDYKTVPLSSKEKKDLQQAARNTLDKKKSISIRLSVRDLARLKEKAAEEGMPYQTLISSTLHKFVTRNEKSEDKNHLKK